MTNTENTVKTVQDLEGARELGRLSGEVRVLKWGAAIVVTMMFAYLTYLAQQIDGVRSDLTQQNAAIQQQFNVTQQQINQVHTGLAQQFNALQQQFNALLQQFNVMQQQFNGMQEGQAAIRERMTVVEQRLVADSSLQSVP